MKKFLLMLGAVALMTACSEDEGVGSGGGSINYEEGYKYLSSLNVSDAKMIYQKTSGASVKSRALGDEDGTYYKLDLNGNESKLVIKGEDGQEHNISINKVVKLSDNILLVNPSAQDIIDLIYKPGPGDPEISTTTDNTDFLSLVDVNTEKIYKWPKEIQVNLYSEYHGGAFETTSDNQGNIYFSSCYDLNYPQYNQIYKLNPNDFTIQKMLPDNVTCNGFTVTDDGFIVYWSGIEQQENCRIKCPGGRIYPVSDKHTFILNGNLYSIRESENTIIRYKTVGNNDIKEETVCQMPEETEFYGYIQSTPNYVRNTMLINNSYEFDGKTCVKLESPVNIGDIVTSKAWYSYNNTTFSKTAMADYQASEFQVLDCEIQTLSSSSESPNITFTGFRYSDGANVVGTIDENDKITIDNVADNGEQIINLIPLN